MQYWAGFGLIDLLVVGALLLAARALYRLVPWLRRLAVPEALLAGGFGLLLGPGLLGLLPLDSEVLERVIYHGLALMFIAMGLRRPARGQVLTPGARSIAFGVPFVAAVQGALGLLLVLAWTTLVGDLHPGVGWMLPLGFSQGPGQALSMGAAWEHAGFRDGTQIGLIMAALGYAWCAVAGVLLFHWGRLRGYVRDEAVTVSPLAAVPHRDGGPATTDQGDMEPLTLQVAQVGLTYLLVYVILGAIAGALAHKPALAAMIWGFHFIFGLVVALGVRFLRDRVLRPFRDVTEAAEQQQDVLLSRIAGLVVDVSAAAAIAAVSLDLFTRYWAPLLVISTVGGVVTIAMTVWLARRAFPEDPFSHALVLFGMSSGTLPTGLVLLRLADPDLRGTAANDVIIGVTGALVLGAPLLLVIMPMPILGWPANYPAMVIETLGVLALYGLALLVGWRLLGPFRLLRPVHHVWPPAEKKAS